jgi:hypothetical protein
MAKSKPPFPVDIDAFDLVNKAPADPEAAASALLLAAGYMRDGKSLPCSLADFLADAIETAMRKPTTLDPVRGNKGQALLVALHLKANNRRPADVRGDEIYYFMKQAMEGLLDQNDRFSFAGSSQRKMRQPKAAKRAAKKFGVAAITVKRIFKAWKETGGRELGPQERQVIAYNVNRLIGRKP